MLLGISEIEKVLFEILQEVDLKGSLCRSLRVVSVSAYDFDNMLTLHCSHIVLIFSRPKFAHDVKVRFVKLLFSICFGHSMQVNLIYSLFLIAVNKLER